MSAFTLSRRSLLQTIAAAGLPLSPIAKAVASAVKDYGNYVWCACVINCGQRCPVRCFVKNDQVIRIETDNTEPDSPTGVPRQIRACQRGRSMRERIYSPDRIKYPMKRVGERGDGKFVRISWDEAVKTIAREWKRIKAAYGNEAIYWQYCSGQQSIVSSRRAWQRLMNLMGGYLKYYGSYSNAQLQAAFPLTFGGRPASLPSQMKDAELVLFFGNNPSVNRPSGAGKGYQMDQAISKHRPRFIIVDPCSTDTCATHADQWIGIRNGTDAALISAMAYEFITHDWVDQEFLDKYCIGYDEKTLPKSAPKNADYKSYILGKGPDKTRRLPSGPLPSRACPSTSSASSPSRLRTPSRSGSPRAGARSARPTANTRAAQSPWCRSCSARSACPARTAASTRATPRSRPCICRSARTRSRRRFPCSCGRTPSSAARK